MALGGLASITGGSVSGISSIAKSVTTTNYASSLSDLGLGDLGISGSSKKNYLLPSNLISKLFRGNGISGQNIYYSSVGYTNPKLGFVSRGLTNSNYSIIQSKLGKMERGEDLDIQTYNYEYTSDVREAMLKLNPSLNKYHWEFSSADVYKRTAADNIYYENAFHPSSEMLVNFNNYKYIYNNPIPVLDGYYMSKGKSVANIYNVNVVPALFNPMFMVQHIGITPNTPLLNTAVTNSGVGAKSDNSGTVADGSIIDVSNCTIKELVNLSYTPKSILGLARYRYIDFMYCKDLGKVANNHLITLRKFPYPIGDNIFEFYDDSAGDIGRLVTWFGTEENKLDDILNFSYKATWKELNAKIEEIESKEDSGNRGVLGMVLNSVNPQYNAMQAAGHAGHQNLFGFLGINSGYSDDNREVLRNYDNNRVYTPVNTIQDTVTYEGKLQFTHEFTLTFCYKLRAYDNINPRSAFLDLIGNVLNVTYRRGKFWGGDRKWIGPPQNISGWKRANQMINNAWKEGGSVISSIMTGKMNLGNLLGMVGNAFSNLFNQAKEAIGNLKEKGASGISNDLLNAFKGSGLGGAALGELKNKLGRPALYAMDSLLKGDNVGLWHVTIGNPKNPIAVMGNLILTNASIQHSGPLGLDDFPTELKVTCTLKHARSRDAVEIGRMYTKGTNGIYYSYLGKGRPGDTKPGSKEGLNSAFAAENARLDAQAAKEAEEAKKAQSKQEADSKTKKTESKTQDKTPVQKAEEEGPAVERTAYVDHRVLDSNLSGYAKYVEHYNQTRIMDIITSENEIA